MTEQVKQTTLTTGPSSAEQMLPNPHIISMRESVYLVPAVEATHTAAVNAEVAALKAGASPQALPMYGNVILHAESVRKQTSDRLTGLLNREGLDMWFERNKPTKFAVFFSDARNFKEVNDTYGHNVGDKVINYIGNTIVSRFRVGKPTAAQVEMRKNPNKLGAEAGIGRWGGDEILTIIDLSDIEEGDNQKVIEAMKKRLDNFGSYNDSENGVVVPVSIRSAAMLGRAIDNKSIDYYQTVLDQELKELKNTEKFS